MSNLVFGFGGSVDLTPCIFKDLGQYPGTIEGTRAVETVEVFERLSCTDDIIPKGEKIGHRMGGGFSWLVNVTAEQIEIMRDENNRKQALYNAKQAEERQQSKKYREALYHSGLCPKCGSWCYGDCEAH